MPTAGPFRILIVNVTLASRTGTECVVRDLALGLKAAGQRPTVYSPELGEIADEIRSLGVPVVSDLQKLPEEPEIVHGNHHAETVEALLQFPTARGIFVCHDRLAPVSAPPRMARILRYVAVDENCLERLRVDHGIGDGLLEVIYNWVDADRFPARSALPRRPRRALVFSNYAGPGTHLEPIRHACQTLGLPLDVVGSLAATSSSAPEKILGRYDLVFAKARCALEAMAVGAAVVLCDTRGLGPLVTSDSVAELRRWNFGMRLLNGPLTPDDIVRQVSRYDAADAAVVSRYIREHASLSSSLPHYLQLYDEVMRESVGEPRPWGVDLGDYVRHATARMGEMEIELARHRRTERMDPLSDAACAGIGVSFESCPERVECGRSLSVRVKVANSSEEPINSFPPFPVYLTYRWFNNGKLVVVEGPRTALFPPLSAGAKSIYTMEIAAPSRPGTYRLRVTLVQERLRWLDSGLPAPVFADETVHILPADSTSSAR